ncbi:hypothetical protein OFR75_00500 [Brachyspira hyodysenteriae]|nr:hypothetical protein [Brachyspira hyodysenteriae]
MELILPHNKSKKVSLGFYYYKNIIEEMKEYANKYKMSLGEYIEEIHNTCKNIKNISKLKMEENTEKITWGVLVEKIILRILGIMLKNIKCELENI